MTTQKVNNLFHKLMDVSTTILMIEDINTSFFMSMMSTPSTQQVQDGNTTSFPRVRECLHHLKSAEDHSTHVPQVELHAGGQLGQEDPGGREERDEAG